MSHRNVRLAVAATATAGLVAGGLASAALAAPHASKPAAPTIKAAFSKSGKLTLDGPSRVPAGAVHFVVRSPKADYELNAVSFKSGYTMKDFEADIQAFASSMDQQGQPSKAGLRHLRHAIRHTFSYGGFDAHPGQSERGALLLNRPGTVYLYNDSSGVPSSVHKLKVTHTVGRGLPASTATVKAKTDFRFGGSKTLPSKGTIKFVNRSTESPHFLVLQQVKEGTTRKQILKYLQSGSQQQPSWALPGGESTDLLTTGEAQTLKLDIPKGEYAEMCFFPDPKTGMPHAFMGMVDIVHAK